jgi:hypothetical protein
VLRSLKRIIRESGFRGPLPQCTDAEEFEPWLEAVNYLIARKSNFADGRSYELWDLASGSDNYTILFAPKGYKIPKSAYEKEAAAYDDIQAG